MPLALFKREAWYPGATCLAFSSWHSARLGYKLGVSRTWWSSRRIFAAGAELGTPQIQNLLELHSKVKVSLSNLEKHCFKI